MRPNFYRFAVPRVLGALIALSCVVIALLLCGSDSAYAQNDANGTVRSFLCLFDRYLNRLELAETQGPQLDAAARLAWGRAFHRAQIDMTESLAAQGVYQKVNRTFLDENGRYIYRTPGTVPGEQGVEIWLEKNIYEPETGTLRYRADRVTVDFDDKQIFVSDISAQSLYDTDARVQYEKRGVPSGEDWVASHEADNFQRADVIRQKLRGTRYQDYEVIPQEGTRYRTQANRFLAARRAEGNNRLRSAPRGPSWHADVGPGGRLLASLFVQMATNWAIRATLGIDPRADEGVAAAGADMSLERTLYFYMTGQLGAARSEAGRWRQGSDIVYAKQLSLNDEEIPIWADGLNSLLDSVDKMASQAKRCGDECRAQALDAVAEAQQLWTDADAAAKALLDGHAKVYTDLSGRANAWTDRLKPFAGAMRDTLPAGAQGGEPSPLGNLTGQTLDQFLSSTKPALDRQLADLQNQGVQLIKSLGPKNPDLPNAKWKLSHQAQTAVFAYLQFAQSAEWFAERGLAQTREADAKKALQDEYNAKISGAPPETWRGINADFLSREKTIDDAFQSAVSQQVAASAAEIREIGGWFPAFDTGGVGPMIAPPVPSPFRPFWIPHLDYAQFALPTGGIMYAHGIAMLWDSPLPPFKSAPATSPLRLTELLLNGKPAGGPMTPSGLGVALRIREGDRLRATAAGADGIAWDWEDGTPSLAQGAVYDGTARRLGKDRVSSLRAYAPGTPTLQQFVQIQANHPPQACIALPVTPIRAGMPVPVDLRATDEDGDSLDVKATFEGGTPSEFTTKEVDMRRQISVTWPAAGSYHVKMRVDDGYDHIDNDAPVTVLPNHPPRITISGGVSSVAVNTDMPIIVRVSDPDPNEELLVTLSLPDNMTGSGTDCTPKSDGLWCKSTLRASVAGSYPVGIEVRDLSGATATSKLVLTVTP